jgi:hypothetical protein
VKIIHVYTNIYMSHSPWALAVIIISIIVLIGSIIAIVWGVTHQNPPGPTCTSSKQCDPTQGCSGGFCVQIPCTLDSQCGPSQTCFNGVCNQNVCFQTVLNFNGGCTGGTICQNELCTPFGMTCGSNQDCFGGELTCVNGICSQCGSNADCGNNGVCAGGVCFPNCSGITGACSSGTMCVADFCCPPGNYPSHCTNTNQCNKGQLCVGNSCTCGKGSYGAICTTNADCASGSCLGSRCVNAGDNCFFNFDSGHVGATGYCPQSIPFCGNGSCSASSLGSPCICFEFGLSTICTPYNSCNMGVIGVSGATGVTHQTTTYCVNSVCSLNPGAPGAGCTSNFDCLPTTNFKQNCNSSNGSNLVCM